jgi:hypothetical protein
MKPVIPAWLLRAQCREHDWQKLGWITRCAPERQVLGAKFACKKCMTVRDVLCPSKGNCVTMKVYDPRIKQVVESDNPGLLMRYVQFGNIPQADDTERAFIEVADYCDELIATDA